MNLYIKKAFINGRRLFGTPLTSNPRGYRTVQDYFFDPDLLTDGAPPNDRGCRACGKIGRLVADCPRKKAADNRKRQEKDRRERQNQEAQRTDDQSSGKRRDRQSQDRVRERQRTMSEHERREAAAEAKKKGEKYEAGGFTKAQLKTKIRSLEKWKRKNGKLSEEEQKLLIHLNSLEKKQRAGEKSKRELEQSEHQRRMFEEAVKNVGADMSTLGLGASKAPELEKEAEQDKGVEAQPKATMKKKARKTFTQSQLNENQSLRTELTFPKCEAAAEEASAKPSVQ